MKTFTSAVAEISVNSLKCYLIPKNFSFGSEAKQMNLLMSKTKKQYYIVEREAMS